MAVTTYVANEFGYFSIIVDSQIFDAVVDNATAAQYFPKSEVYLSFWHTTDSPYSQTALDSALTNGFNASVVEYGTTPASGSNYFYTTLAENRQIRASKYYRGGMTTAMLFGSAESITTNSDFPTGLATPTYLSITVLLLNDSMTQSKGISLWFDASGSFSISLRNLYGIDFATFFQGLTPYVPPRPDPYDGLGEDELAGDTIGLDNEPTLSPIDAGLFSLYSPTAAQMRNLADFLWTDFGGTGTTVEQVLEEVVEALKRSVSNPLNSMLGLSIIASQGLSKGSDSSVHVGFWNTGVSMTKLIKQYFTVNCGSLSFSPVCGNTFLDYAPYSKFMIYLPYVGMRLLDANDVVGHTISVRYRGDCVSGALACYVIRDGSVIQEHMGNCALNIPLTADSWAETISGVAQLISGTVSGAAMGGGAGAAAGAVRGAASVATNPSALSPQVSHTGAVSGAAGHLGSQKPFILREAVRFHSTGNFNNIIGYPAYYYRKLGDCHGYTQCLEVHLSHTPCTGVELQEIEELLKKGVII